MNNQATGLARDPRWRRLTLPHFTGDAPSGFDRPTRFVGISPSRRAGAALLAETHPVDALDHVLYFVRDQFDRVWRGHAREATRRQVT